MKRVALAIGTAAAALVATLQFPLAAQAGQIDPGSSYDRRGYEIKQGPNAQPYCLGYRYGGTVRTEYPWVTPSCNYRDGLQQFIARRDGRWGTLENAGTGQCWADFGPDPAGDPGNIIGHTFDCTGGYRWQWARTPLGQWKNRATGQCLTGHYDSTSLGWVSTLPCMNTYVQKWIATG